MHKQAERQGGYSYIQRRGGDAIAVQADRFEADGYKRLVAAEIAEFSQADICIIGPGEGRRPKPIDKLNPRPRLRTSTTSWRRSCT